MYVYFVATALGPARTRSELLGFLNGQCYPVASLGITFLFAESIDDEDEVLSVMAEELG